MFIKVANVTKIFKTGSFARASLLIDLLTKKNYSSSRQDNEKRALDNVAFDVHEGERIGIIGRNGAGKSTLLHLIAGLDSPTDGRIIVDGRVTCIMTLGIGLRDDLTGRENIYIDGTLHGKSHEEVAAYEQEVIEFAELGEFIDRPLHTYSSGMKARLAFSLITTIDPEILIVDEALGAGDARFSQKAAAKIKDICARGRIVLLVSHSMSSIKEMCKRCIWLDDGKIRLDGASETVVESYLENVRQEKEAKLAHAMKRRLAKRHSEAGVKINTISFSDMDGNTKKLFDINAPYFLDFTITVKAPIEKTDIRVRLDRLDGLLLLDNWLSKDLGDELSLHDEITFRIPLYKLNLGANTYEATIELYDRSSEEKSSPIAYASAVLKIENEDYPHQNPICWFPSEWSFYIDNSNRKA